VTQATVPTAHEFMPHSAPSVAPGAHVVHENLELFGAGFFEAAGPALTTALNRPLAVRVLGVTSVTLRQLLEELEAPWVFVEITYQRGMTGSHWLVVSRRNALALAGDPETIDLEPRHKEAIRSTVNQLLHAAAPPLMPLFARSVAYAPVTVHVVMRDEPLPGDLAPEDRMWLVRAQGMGDELAIDMALTIDEALAAEICALGASEPEPAAAAPAPPPEAPPAKIDLILDVTLPIAVELGRARMQIQDILKLAPGSVITLDKSAGDPVELFINDRAIAKGEVVIIDENFGVRLTSIVTATERIRTLR
jgi:flagellar motor switch protein FliN/FliY